jgi:hypothetical protein
MSNIVPKRDISLGEDISAENKNTRTMPSPEAKSQDFGIFIFPSKNLAIDQKIKVSARPIVKSKPLEVSTGMFVKGKTKRGNNTSTKNNDKNESLSNIFEFI